MPTILSHTVVPLALGAGLGKQFISRRLLICGVACSMLPDLDVLAFRLGIPYANEFGHRGFSHSLLLAFLIAMLGALSWRWLRSDAPRTFGFLFCAAASHPVLDTLTNGGLGIALLWPWSETRYFAPFRPIEVSPIGLSRFLSEQGVHVLASEILWVWLPCSFVYLLIASLRLYVFKKEAAAIP